MLYCPHCAYLLDEDKVENKSSSYDLTKEIEIDEEAQIKYVCPRCGHLIHANLNHDEVKELSRASHAQVQRGNNSFASGMCLNLLGVILLIISLIFFILSNKPAKGFVMNCGEFYVAVATMVISVILLSFGIFKTVVGLRLKMHYTKLLKGLNNQTFVQ